MEYKFGNTWEVPGASWEKFECTLEWVDYEDICAELRLEPRAVPVKFRHLILREYGKRIEAFEKSARGYMSPDEYRAATELATQHLDNLRLKVEVLLAQSAAAKT